ncbi:hypothetical protein Daus18300_000351 [Diaporthe australafricana]|uniref:Uncharacterized protein n=1 Tax=Diaporthe australafricana TaxID=127596 RepID=A0ABR3Y5G9_9PEZI
MDDGHGGMEALLQGSPMMMQTGDMPLALSSWHIYPDLNIVSNTTNKLVRQKDRLFPPSGILTIGLERQDSASSKGLQWSLPLAHLRYYGDPVTRVSELTIQGSRLSLLDFDMAVLGCVLGSWGITDCDPDAIKWISTASDLVGRTYAEESHEIDTTWLRLLGKTASEFLKSKDAEKQRFTKLLYLGIGRCSFIEEEEAPFFGLTSLYKLIRMMRTTEQRIRVLRAHAQRAGIRFEQAIIWYISDSNGREEFASAVPRNRSTIKRPSPESGSSWSKTSVSHVRWVHQAYTQLGSPDDGFVDPPAGIGVRTYTVADEKNTAMEKILIADKTYPIVCQEQQADGALHQARYQDEAMSEEVLPVEAGEIQALFELDKEVTRPSWTKNEVGSSKPVRKDPYGVMTRYGQWIGDFEIASMFVRSDHDPAVLEFESMVSSREMVSLFEQDEIDPEAFIRELVGSIRFPNHDYRKKLQAYSTMHSLYSTLGQVTIDVRVLQKDLSIQWIDYLFQADTIKPGTSTKDDQEPTQNRQGIASRDKVSSGGRGETEHKAPREGLAWEVLRMRVNSPDMPSRRDPMVQGDTAVKELLRLTGPVEMTESQAFFCILMFETSYFLFPSRLEGVMAISSGNSLFVASSLLSDPYSLPSEPKISHVMGNIGRPGTLLLVPPVQPRMIAPGIERWPLLTFRDWDGVGNDSFPDSSLHLWFTGSTQEINEGYDGAHDQELCMIESVVSLHDKGEWVADLDILKVLRQSQCRLDRQNETIPPDVRRRFVLYEASKERRADTCCEENHISQYSPQKLPLTAIETWWELLERSSKNCVFLATGNWQARLAAMIICFAQGRKVSIISNPVCWDCVADTRRTLNKPEDPIVYIY